MGDAFFRVPLHLPAQAATEPEATIVSWYITENALFEKGQLLAEVESAKSTFDFEAPCDGRVVALHARAGETIRFDVPVMTIETPDASMKQNAAVVPAAADLPSMERPAIAPVPSVARPKARILGIGAYLPQRVVSTAELVAEFDGLTEDYIVGVTGIRERRWARDDEKPSDMAYHAALQAIEKSGMTPDRIGAIILSTTTPDVIMPATACILQEKLGARGIPCFDLNAACSGWLYALTVAQGLIAAGSIPNALVVAVDMQSRLLEPSDKGTYFLFGDGAGAAVVSGDATRGHVIMNDILIADSKGLHMARRSYPGYRLPADDPSVDPWVRLDGYALFRFATENFASIIRDVIEKSGWQPDAVRRIVPHQANGRILKAAAQRCGVPFERFYVNIEHVGNTSSASIPLALAEMEKTMQRGDKIVLCSVGAGITAAAMTIEW